MTPHAANLPALKLSPRLEVILFGRKSKAAKESQVKVLAAAIDRRVAALAALKSACDLRRAAPSATTEALVQVADAEVEAAYAAELIAMGS